MSSTERKMNLLSIIIGPTGAKRKGIRVDRALAGFEQLPSRSQIKEWFSNGLIRRGTQILEASDLVYEDDKILIDVPPAPQSNLEARPHPLQIFYEDENLIVLYKERGMSMHPGAQASDETTLVHALLGHPTQLSSSGGYFRPGIVHRLDKDTEGIVVVAKDNKTHEALSQQFAKRTIQRRYWALCYGEVPAQIQIVAPIGRHPVLRKKMAVVARGRESETLVERIDSFPEGYSWVRCKLKSGRTHQIRVHMQHKGYPVLNDPVYSNRSLKSLNLSEAKSAAMASLRGQTLMAYELGFHHPTRNENLLFQAEMPEWLKIMTTKN
ncbi:MAG: RNA pseudouridine synthase [Deltaproteobacteria bacterium CG11_big_fil_rev_8_21_14_0_20_45_16]|nr:MAG: RNA pseudouridine synthase [Deltaproteobacteria bacterium CG11_big_fil_rev_8_21_14_0_20_45_16]